MEKFNKAMLGIAKDNSAFSNDRVKAIAALENANGESFIIENNLAGILEYIMGATEERGDIRIKAAQMYLTYRNI